MAYGLKACSCHPLKWVRYSVLFYLLLYAYNTDLIQIWPTVNFVFVHKKSGVANTEERAESGKGAAGHA